MGNTRYQIAEEVGVGGMGKVYRGIDTTAEHSFYTDDGLWIDAADLTIGEMILSLDGDYGTVERVVLVEDADQPMYNLTVDEVHTFAVGDGEWVVHNRNARFIDW